MVFGGPIGEVPQGHAGGAIAVWAEDAAVGSGGKGVALHLEGDVVRPPA